MTRNPYILAAAVAGLAVVGFGLYARSRGGVGQAASDIGEAIGGGAVRLADGAVSGAVVGAGQLVGIPPTDETQCERDLAAGRTWDASFSCPAGTFIGAQWRRWREPAVDQTVLDPRDAWARGTGAGTNQAAPPPAWDAYVQDQSRAAWGRP